MMRRSSAAGGIAAAALALALLECTLSTMGTGAMPAPCAKTSDCAGANDPCNPEVCDDGSCTTHPDANAAPDDANDCTADACVDGIAQHTPLDSGSCVSGKGTCKAGKCIISCMGDAICDDNNPCTMDACDGASHQCAWTAIADGPTPGGMDVLGDCRRDVCLNGVHKPHLVDDSDTPPDQVCQTESCANGIPKVTPEANGTSCGASVLCDGMGHCVGCTQAAQCKPPSCQQATCVSQQCVYTPTAADTPCSGPGNAKVCDGAGTCVPCNSAAQCDDGDPCNGSETCVGHVCNPGTPVYCPSKNGGCTVGACVSGVCVYQAVGNGMPCDDGNACTGPDSCQSGLCAAGSVSCDDGQPCTSDSCDPITGCVHTPLQNGTPCGGTSCNGNTYAANVCQGGMCITSSSSCPGTYTCNNSNSCQSCSDGARNGSETDTDCGGGSPCPPCGLGQGCLQATDCSTGLGCIMGKCSSGAGG